MATVLADRKDRRRKWWAKQMKAKTKSKDGPEAVGGGNKKEKMRNVDSFEGDVREHTQFEEKKTEQLFLNKSGFRSSRTITKETPQNNLSCPRTKIQGSTRRKNTTTSIRQGADILKSRQTDTLPTECDGGEESTSDLAGSDSDETETAELPGKKQRYIAFIGNLPFSVTRDDVVEHFATRGVKIMDARVLTKRGSGASRGCCFAEFPNTKSLQNALKFHHSLMDGRRLNVEVTCGGGGRGEGRMKKIRERNERLRKARRKRVKGREEKVHSDQKQKG